LKGVGVVKEYEYFGLALAIDLFIGLTVGMLVPTRFNRKNLALFVAGFLAFLCLSAFCFGYVAILQNSMQKGIGWSLFFAIGNLALSYPAAILGEFVLHLRARRKSRPEGRSEGSSL